MKSPIGSSSRNIENTIRKALTQSSNIIIDLARKRGNVDKCIKEVRKQAALSGNKIKSVLIIVDRDRIIEVK
ncbi:hypothetical protein IJM16_03585 [Candidatus Saccharibacteria bacterium]|nr:hypothetical protein [Candidatus Saccharibacteria bacterium]